MSGKTYYSCAETAKLIRAALKVNFPGVKFSVRSKTYSGGASINVGWTDGPTTKEVDGVAKMFQGATFDGMIDLKSYVDTVVSNPDGSLSKVHYGADFVFCDRSFSKAQEDAARAALKSAFPEANLEDHNSKVYASVFVDDSGKPQFASCSWATEYAPNLVDRYLHNLPAIKA